MIISNDILKKGDAGVIQTVELMKKFTLEYANNPEIKKIVSDIERVLLSREQFPTKCKMRYRLIWYIFYYIVRNLNYVPDPPGVELVKSAKHTILGNSKNGDCDDLSVALATLLKAAGYNVWFRTGAWKPESPDTYTHVWVMVELPCGEKVMPLDPSMKEAGYGNQVKYIKKRDFAI